MPEPEIGQFFDRYQLVARIEDGRLVGPVFKAYDPTLMREVALKVVHLPENRPDLADPIIQRARDAARLDHPSLVKVHDFGRENSWLYVVMDFIPGGSLRQLLLDLRANNQWLLLAEAVGIVGQLCGVFDYLNQQNVPPRGIEPADVMFKPDPTGHLPYRPVLTSLGLPDPVESAAGEPAYAYWSPEQALAEPMDARSEVYSLGVLLYELAVGWQPFAVKTISEAVRAHTRAVPPPPRGRRADLPAPLEAIILRALEKDPAARFPNPGAMAQALEEAWPLAQQVDSANAATGAWAVSLLVPYQRSVAATASTLRAEAPPEEPEVEHRPAFYRFDGTVVDANLIQSSPDGQVGVYLEISQITITPGQPTSVAVILVNQGVALDHFSLLLSGLPAGWIAAPQPPSSVALSPGDFRRVTVTIAPPRSPASRAGRYTLLVRAASQQRPEQLVEAKLALTVSAFSQFRTELSAATVNAGEPVRVQVHNQGNTQEAYTVAFEEPEGQLAFVPPAATFSVPEGKAGAADFVPGPRRQRLLGGRQVHPYGVRIAGSSGEAQILSAEVVSTGLVPVWLPLLAMFMVCMLVGGGLFAYNGYIAGQSGTATAAARESLDAIGAADQDKDGLSTNDELQRGTDPLKPDTDSDGLLDGEEVVWSSNPLVPDSDGDTLPDGQEVHDLHTSPINPDTDGDGAADNVDPDPGNLPTPTASPTPIPSATNTGVPPTETATLLASATAAPSATVLATDTVVPATASPTDTASPEPTAGPSPTPEGGQGVMIFISERSGQPNIFQMLGDGSNEVRLSNTTPTTTTNEAPAWSAAAQRLAFESNRDGNLEIYVMQLDGSSALRLTTVAAADTAPVWSPDGTRIAFVSERDGNPEIYVMNADGSSQTRLTNDGATDNAPAWSPDGTRILFTAARDGNPELYRMNADGSVQTRLTNNTVLDGEAGWAPNGAWIAFTRDTGALAEIYLMNADGTGQLRLTNNAFADTNPVWASNGARLAFVSERDGNPEIYLMVADGSAQTRLTNSPARDADPVWSPTGTRLAFATERDGNSEVYAMNMDGSGQTRLTDESAADTPALWLP
jgi:Tol biopolymer transport system component/serine/threonine protein kinase